ncbi:MAG: protein kinase [Candidatus Aminicenantes bacterium]|nr:protein kinase [Candidatus Aminicenantes bacterium]
MKCPKCQAEVRDDSRFCSKCGAPIHPSDETFISQTRTILKPIEELMPGTELAGKYRIDEVAGRGGMGIVYKAEDTKLKRHVALKFLPPELIKDKQAKERFILEARTAAALSHPNICTIHEINEQDSQSFIAMEYVEGKNLREILNKGPLEIEKVLDITIQIAQGLDEAHRKGIIHRDIKSSNVMVTEKGQAKIMDFGLAKIKGTTLFTRKGTTLGTVAYMSPEQARGKDLDHRSDIWSLGVMLYEMLSGELPFTGDREASILYSVVHEEPKPLKEIRRDLPPELQQITNRALRKKRESRYGSAAEMLADLKKFRDALRAEELGAFNLRKFLRRILRPRISIPAVCGILVITLASVWFANRRANIRWAREEMLPQIESLVEGTLREFTEPYRLAVEAEKFIPKNPKLAELFVKCSLNSNITTEPPGADVYVKEYQAPDSEWEYLGVSPLEKIRLPIGIFRWKLEKEGYETVLAASTNWNYNLKEEFIPFDLVRILDKKGSIPEDMVRVSGTQMPFGKLDDFFIGRFEVTNKQYKEFVNSGGYQNKKYWKHQFIKNGEVLTWEEAMAQFVDQTNRPGPAAWQAGDYPEGRENYPVSGISWYEAAAFAEFAGKSLPTRIHWGLARGERTPIIMWFQMGGNAIFAPLSNFQGQGPAPTGNYQGMTVYGAFDMAGNVREWCWNKTPKGRLMRGGAWNDNAYMFGNLSQAFPFDRSSNNGFRYALYPHPEKIPEAVFRSVEMGGAIDFYKEKPVSDTAFKFYKEQFSYDKTDPNGRVEWKDEKHEDWIEEQISFDAAYGEDRVIAILFLPKNASPPYQTVIYFPGAQAGWRKSSREIGNAMEFKIFLSFIIKNGRAAVYPVYKGTMERNFKRPQPWQNSFRQTEYRIQVVKDFRRCIDYLETRPDIDSQKVAYYGMSWGGGWPGQLIPAVEDRLKACIILGGGLHNLGRPEINPINYVSRVKTPFLIISGKYDANFVYETSSKPLFDLLGTPAEHKEHKLYETDHIAPRNEFIKEILAWLDRYLGPVKR